MSIFYLDTEGFLWVKGENNRGQLGLGDYRIRYVFEKVSVILFSSVSSSGNHTVALDLDGHLWSCGANNYGQLGIGNNRDQVHFRKVSDVVFTYVCCGKNHTVAIDIDGNLWTCGLNKYGQLGIGKGANYNFYNVLQKMADKKYLTVSCGNNNTIAIDDEGLLWYFGKKIWIKKGPDQYFLPQRISTEKFENIFCGRNNAVAISTNGELWYFGQNIKKLSFAIGPIGPIGPMGSFGSFGQDNYEQINIFNNPPLMTNYHHDNVDPKMTKIICPIAKSIVLGEYNLIVLDEYGYIWDLLSDDGNIDLKINEVKNFFDVSQVGNNFVALGENNELVLINYIKPLSFVILNDIYNVEKLVNSKTQVIRQIPVKSARKI